MFGEPPYLRERNRAGRGQPAQSLVTAMDSAWTPATLGRATNAANRTLPPTCTRLTVSGRALLAFGKPHPSSNLRWAGLRMCWSVHDASFKRQTRSPGQRPRRPCLVSHHTFGKETAPAAGNQPKALLRRWIRHGPRPRWAGLHSSPASTGLPGHRARSPGQRPRGPCAANHHHKGHGEERADIDERL